MSVKGERRRRKPSGEIEMSARFCKNSSRSVPVKQAYEDDDPTNEDAQTSKKTREKRKSSTGKRGHRRTESRRKEERGLFTINNITVEVMLRKDTLSWSIVPNEAPATEAHGNPSNGRTDTDSVNLHDVYAISAVYDQWQWLLNSHTNASDANGSTAVNSKISSPAVNPHLRGFRLHTYDRADDNMLKESLILFQSDSSLQIEGWYQLLSKIIAKCMCTGRTSGETSLSRRLLSDRPPRTVLVVCNAYAGSRDSRLLYNTKLKPLFEQARYNVIYSGLSIRTSTTSLHAIGAFSRNR